MEDIDTLDICSSSYFPFSNDKNDEYSNIDKLFTSDTIEREDTTNYSHKQDKKSSKKHASKTNSQNSDPDKSILQINLQKKKKHSDISKIADPFMSARQVSLQPLNNEQSEEMDECDMASGSEDECRDQNLVLEDDMPCKLISELPTDDINHQKDCDKKISCKDKETKLSKIKPVFGKPSKNFDHASKKSKLSKDNVSGVKSVSTKHKSLSSDIDLDGPKSISDPNQCVITDEDEDSFCLSAKVCPQVPLQKNNEEGEQIVPNFSWKKKKSKSKHLEKSPLLKVHATSVLESSKDSESEKLNKTRSLTEISSAVLNSDHHHKKDNDSNKDEGPSEKKSKKREKKKKLKNSTEKSNTCSVTAEDDQSSPQIEEVCNIPKKKRKKSRDNSLFANEHEVENNGPVISNIRSLADNLNQNQNPVETLCPGQNDQPTPESPDNTDHQEHKKKKKKKKSKAESPKEEHELYEKPVKRNKKKKKEDSDKSKNVKVEKMPPEMVPSFKESEDEETVNISEEVKDPSSDNEEAKVVSPERKMESKSLENSKQKKEFSVKKKVDKTRKKNGTKHQEKHSKEKSKNKCHSSEHTKDPCKKLCMQKREILDTGTWVQCTNSECLKWRFLCDVQDPITVPMLWTCEMNSDPKQNDCSYPEIMPCNKDSEEFIYTKYTEGTVVWARVDGYPWWPAMVEMDPDSLSYFDIETEDSMYPKFYHVVFFGKKVSRAWVTLSNVAPFMENKPPPVNKGTPRIRTQEFNTAEKLAAKALDIPINTRLKVFSFSNRYKGSWADCTCKACLRAMPTDDVDNEEDI